MKKIALSAFLLIIPLMFYSCPPIPPPTYSVFYEDNGATSGSLPTDSNEYEEGDIVTVQGNNGNLAKTGYIFSNWNTVADGSGEEYVAGTTFVMGANHITLYAQWIESTTYTVTYNGNGNTGGTVPVDTNEYIEGDTVTVLGNTGNIVKIGYNFEGWNTIANGSGVDCSPGDSITIIEEDITFYAQWTLAPTAPHAPSDVTASPFSSTQIDLRWTDNSNNEDGFNIERKTGLGGTYAQIGTVSSDTTSYSDTGLSPNTTYYYQVIAYNGIGDSSYSNEASSTTADVAPSSPSGLTATAVSTSQINLSWTDNSDNENGFILERKTGADGTYSHYHTPSSNTTSYSNIGLTVGTTYYYRIMAYNGIGNSAYSNEAYATTLLPPPPAAPTGLSSSYINETRIDLNWTDNSTDEDGFKIERKTEGGTYNQIDTVGINQTSYNDTSVSPFLTYYYQVRSYNVGGDSAYSNEVTETTVLNAPTSLTASVGSSTSVSLSWIDTSNCEIGFIIERKPEEGTYSVINTVGHVTTYTDSGLTQGITYYYRIRAYNSLGDSAYSNETIATPQISFAEHTLNGRYYSPTSVHATDLDGDDDIDVLGTSGYLDVITWWENDGNENFTEHTIGTFDVACCVYPKDVDGDGDVDILATNYSGLDVTWWENDGSENFTEHIIDWQYNGASSVFAIDLDNDGDVDVLSAASIDNEITWWENDGNEDFTEHTVDGGYSGARSIYAIDVDGDSDFDILGAGGNSITWWENDGNENFTEYSIDLGFSGASSVHAIDVDGDSDIDVLGASSDFGDITWWENDGNENFTEHTIDGGFSGASSVYAIDIDGDTDIDVLGAARDDDDITWWENDGSENFTQYAINGNYNGANNVYAADIDSDGDIDILGTANYAGVITWWENDLY